MHLLLILLYSLGLYRLRFILPALLLHAVLISGTAMTFGRIPLMGMRETLGFLAFAIGVLSLVPGWYRKRDLFTSLSIPLIILLLAGASLSSPVEHSLPPVLKTIWFELHVILSFVSYALFAIGAVYGVLALATDEPGAERNQYRSLLVG